MNAVNDRTVGSVEDLMSDMFRRWKMNPGTFGANVLDETLALLCRRLLPDVVRQLQHHPIQFVTISVSMDISYMSVYLWSGNKTELHIVHHYLNRSGRGGQSQRELKAGVETFVSLVEPVGCLPACRSRHPVRCCRFSSLSFNILCVLLLLPPPSTTHSVSLHFSCQGL